MISVLTAGMGSLQQLHHQHHGNDRQQHQGSREPPQTGALVIVLLVNIPPARFVGEKICEAAPHQERPNPKRNHDDSDRRYQVHDSELLELAHACAGRVLRVLLQRKRVLSVGDAYQIFHPGLRYEGIEL